jgi:hypothetical protein
MGDVCLWPTTGNTDADADIADADAGICLLLPQLSFARVQKRTTLRITLGITRFAIIL